MEKPEESLITQILKDSSKSRSVTDKILLLSTHYAKKLLIAACFIRDINLVKTIFSLHIEDIDANCVDISNDISALTAAVSDYETFGETTTLILLCGLDFDACKPLTVELVNYLLENGADVMRLTRFTHHYFPRLYPIDYLLKNYTLKTNKPALYHELYDLLANRMTRVIQLDGDKRIEYNLYKDVATMDKEQLFMNKTCNSKGFHEITFYKVIETYSVNDDEPDVFFIYPSSTEKTSKYVAKCVIVTTVDDAVSDNEYEDGCDDNL